MEKQSKELLINRILLRFYYFLSKSDKLPKRTYLTDFNRMAKEIKPADVLLLESHTHFGNIVRLITESTWTHAALYIGRPQDIEDQKSREIVLNYTKQFSSDQLLIESTVGYGTIISPLDKYKNEHIRIVRPSSLLPEDTQKVINYAIHDIGTKYSLRHVFDLARFLFPWSIFPRRWRSSLFQHNMLQPTEDICSSMIADAFQSVNYPILPILKEGDEGYGLIRRNPRLYTPSDFDLSPFFDVIKYPVFPLKKGLSYRDLPWKKQMMSNDVGIVKITSEKHGKNNPTNK